MEQTHQGYPCWIAKILLECGQQCPNDKLSFFVDTFYHSAWQVNQDFLLSVYVLVHMQQFHSKKHLCHVCHYHRFLFNLDHK